MQEHTLSGGNATDRVVRVRETVRKPWTAATPSVTAFVQAVRAAGVDAPEPLGQDEAGRSVQEFIHGRIALDQSPLSFDDLRRVGSIVRAIHDASAQFAPPENAAWECAIPAPGRDLVCHNDLAPWNLIIGERWVFIDWDAAAPSTRLWDLACAAQAFTLNDPRQSPHVAARNLAAFVDGYRADETMRTALPAEMGRRTAAMHTLLQTSAGAGQEPWASMYASGHGAHWAAALHFVDSHQDVWGKALAD
jgi:hypothetical protein